MPRAGQRLASWLPPARAAAGGPPDALGQMVLRWNDMPATPGAIDLVLHLHGYSAAGPDLDLAAEKLPLSGLDFADPDDQHAGQAVVRPTLGILPHGRWFGGRTGHGFDFPHLAKPGAVGRLVASALDEFAALAGVGQVEIGRRVLSAHSGGGAALGALIGAFDPDLVLVFDALYAPAPALEAWTRNALGQARPAGGLRAFFVEGTGTEAASRSLRQIIDEELRDRNDAGLCRRFRVEATTIDHGQIARRLGWRLLADSAIDLDEPIDG